MTDEQQWNRLKNEYHFSASSFLNLLQTVSATDLENADTVKKLVAMRYYVADAFLHIYMFIEDANDLNFTKILSTQPQKPSNK